MPGQQTFRLVPTTLVNSVGARPPMTSKAAKAAYRKATKGPKISRAEQRRLDAEEIERQKKEYEKERNAAKAKAAREKKLKKEREVKEERKKRGLPEPSRFVRASQPTIKGFVRVGVGAKRSWEDMESGDEEVTVGGKVEGPPNKIRALEVVEEEEDFGEFPSLPEEEEEVAVNGAEAISKTDRPAVTTKLVAQSDEEDFGDFPVLSQEFEDVVLSEVTVPKTEKPAVAKEIAMEQYDEHEDFGDFLSLSQISQLMDGEAENERCAQMADRPPTHTEPSKQSAEDEDFEDFGDFPTLSQGDFGLFDMPSCEERATKVESAGMATVNKPQQIHLPVTKSLLNTHQLRSLMETSNIGQKVDEGELDILVESQLASEAFGSTLLQTSKPSRQPQSATTLDTNTPQIITVNGRSSRMPLGDVSTNMAPPPPRLPKAFQGQHHNFTRTVANQFSGPPPSTMAFLEANLDDFFPTPSQQVRELLDDIDDMPSNTQVAWEINFEQPAAAFTQLPPPVPIINRHLDLKKQVNSSVQSETKKLVEPQKQSDRKRKFEQQKQPKTEEQSEPETQLDRDDLGLHLLSSQDFEISSQDLREMEIPSRVAAKITRRPTSSHEDLGLVWSDSPEHTPSKAKPRFFQEKEEDLFHAAVHESLALSRR